jgi:molybdopterin synthase catalytic subunit
MEMEPADSAALDPSQPPHLLPPAAAHAVPQTGVHRAVTLVDGGRLRVEALITDAPLSVGDAYAAAGHPSCGAVAAFVGTTRDHHGGRPVARLEYEAHTPLALRMLGELGAAADARCGGALVRVYVAHRLGVVPVGDASVVITASSPHRREALDAVAWLIDELKATLPVWKKEWYVAAAAPAAAEVGDGAAAAAAAEEEGVWKANSECCWGHDRGGAGGKAAAAPQPPPPHSHGGGS